MWNWTNVEFFWKIKLNKIEKLERKIKRKENKVVIIMKIKGREKWMDKEKKLKQSKLE